MKTRCFLLALAGVPGLVSPASAGVLLSDDFSDGDRTNQNLPASAAWNSAHSGSTSLTANGARQNLLSDAPSVNNSQVWTTFGSTTLAAGETLNVTFNFDVSGGSNSSTNDGGMRIGLFNVGTPVTTDLTGSIASSNWTAATGYSAFVDVSPSANTTGVSTFRQRTGSSQTLWAVAATTAISTTVAGNETVFTGTSTNLTTDPLRFLASLSLTRTGEDSVDLLLTITGNGTSHTLSATDLSGTATTFNTFSVFTGNGTAQDFALDNVVISVIPEPSSLILAGIAPVVLGLRRRR